MEDKANIFDKIERYLQQEMKPEERTSFEQALKKDVLLQKQYEHHVAANELLLERRLLKVRAKTKVYSTKKASSGKAIIYGTALVGFLALLTTIIFFTTSTSTEDTSILSTDSIIINTTKKSDPAFKAVILDKDSSAYDTLIQTVQNRDKNPKSQVDLIYESIQQKDKLKKEKKDAETKAKKDSIVQDKKIKKQNDPKTVNSETVNKSPEPEVISCDDYIIHFNVETKNSCFDKELGSVSIKVETQDMAPYTYHVFNEYEEKVSTHDLGKGSYSVYITDKNGCKSNSLGFFIEEDLCLGDYLINTTYNETFLLKEMKDKYHFKVYDKAGKLYYEQQVKEYEMLEWDGKNNKQQIIAGYYLVKVEFTDGDVKKGSITIQN